jgi:hypothetical protein
MRDCDFKEDLFVLTLPLTSSNTSLTSFRSIYITCFNLISDRCYYLRKSELLLPVLSGPSVWGFEKQDRFINECLIKGTVLGFFGRVAVRENVSVSYKD